MRVTSTTKYNRKDLQGRLDALAGRLTDFKTRVAGESVLSRSDAIAAANDMAYQSELAVQKLRLAGGLDDRASAGSLEAVAVLLDDLEESLTDDEAIRATAAR
ncbi:MAG: hypothetical protein EXQ97_01740 [Alphaproteobacteria bacterium]|nr:hypothetical protein [Alphaproteobacteria bacterium]